VNARVFEGPITYVRIPAVLQRYGLVPQNGGAGGISPHDSWEAIVGAFRYINLVVYALLILFVFWIGFKVTDKELGLNAGE
jgi:hypothetical protein